MKIFQWKLCFKALFQLFLFYVHQSVSFLLEGKLSLKEEKVLKAWACVPWLRNEMTIHMTDVGAVLRLTNA